MSENREAWLTDAIDLLREVMHDRADIEVPQVRVSPGFPSRGGTSLKKRVLGECWKPAVADDGISQIFLNPMMDDPMQILGTLTHELIHAWDKGEHGHRGPFVQAAKDVGLTGPWTATSVGPDLEPLLADILTKLGDYPHSKLTPSIQRKPQTTRMIKVVCPFCDYTVRTTQKWLDSGLPMCPDGDDMEVEVK